MTPLLLLASASLLAAIPRQSPEDWVRLERSLDGMGTTYTIAVYGPDKFQLDSAMEDAFDEVRRLDQLLSNYRPESEWSQVNQRAYKEPVQVSGELFSLLAEVPRVQPAERRHLRHHGGPADEGLGILQGHRAHSAPRGDPHRRWQTWASRTSSSTRPKRRCASSSRASRSIPAESARAMRWTAWRTILRKHGITSGLISAGRSSIYAIGAPPEEPRGWQCSLPNPREHSQGVGGVLSQGRVDVHSGNYEKFFIAGGQDLQPHHGSAHRLSGAGHAVGFGHRTQDARQRGLDQTVLYLGRQWAAKHKPKDFRVFLCEDRIGESHARGSNELAAFSMPAAAGPPTCGRCGLCGRRAGT